MANQRAPVLETKVARDSSDHLPNRYSERCRNIPEIIEADNRYFAELRLAFKDDSKTINAVNTPNQRSFP